MVIGRTGDEVEARLAARAKEGDERAYGELVRRQRIGALRLATVVLGSSEGADDVVQLALERAWRAIDSFEVGRPFRPWLLGIVANVARNDRRAAGRRARLVVRAAAREGNRTETTPEEVAVSSEDREMVVAALNRLGPSDRTVIALRYFERLSEADMAAVLDCAPGTVKSRLSRALGRLRAEMVGDDAGELAHG